MILIGALVLVLVVVIVAQLLFSSKAPAPAPQGSTPVNGGSSGMVSIPNTPSGGSQQSGMNAQSKEAVQAAFAARLATSNPDNIKTQDVVIAGEFALQDWAGDVTAGEALLRYDSAQDTWTVVASTGGAWSVEELVQYHGVPADVAAQLVPRGSR